MDNKVPCRAKDSSVSQRPATSNDDHWQNSISNNPGSVQSQDEPIIEPISFSGTTSTTAAKLMARRNERKWQAKPPPVFESMRKTAVRSGTPTLVHAHVAREPRDQTKTGGVATTRGYSLTQSRVMTQVVAMLYFAGFLCTNSLMPQYMVLRLTKDGQGLVNGSQTAALSSPCNKSNSSSTAHADAIQSKASQEMLSFTLAASIPSLFTCLFAGGYSDTFGRRPLLLTGCLTGSLKMLLTSIIIKLELPTWLFYIAYATDGLSGSWTILFVMLVSSIADTNPDKKDRAFWVAVLGCAISVVGAILLVLTGVLIDKLGFFAASIMCVASASLAFILALFFFPETFPPQRDKKLTGLASVRKIANYFFLGGSLRERLRLWTCLFIFMLTVVPQLCLVTMDTLYLLHRPFCWTHSNIGIYSGARMAGTFLTGIIILRLFQNCCQPEILAMVGLMFQTASFVLEAESKKFWHMLLVPVVDSPSTISIPVIRAILSSLGSSADQDFGIFMATANLIVLLLQV
ncbi:hypothetical protein RRG08_001335 [Elysia crispata]|uniref:Proton-coupled folate transporter n=1 Tax=Elysia crispata TaxID=231223 RepID=A0AAE0ZRE3_9GAST|nr:hypothetical protein RRG08_001335 [Elysia crispata]